MHATVLSRWPFLLGVSFLGVVLAGCGGGGSSTGPSGSSESVKRLQVRVARTSTAQAPASFTLARLAALLGWPQVAEAQVQGCQVSAGGVTATTNADGEAVLQNVPTTNGNVTVTIDCPPLGPGGSDGSFVLTGLANGTIVTVVVEVEPGQVTVKAKDVDVSPSPSPDPSPQTSPSPSVSQKKGS